MEAFRLFVEDIAFTTTDDDSEVTHNSSGEWISNYDSFSVASRAASSPDKTAAAVFEYLPESISRTFSTMSSGKATAVLEYFPESICQTFSTVTACTKNTAITARELQVDRYTPAERQPEEPKVPKAAKEMCFADTPTLEFESVPYSMNGRKYSVWVQSSSSLGARGASGEESDSEESICTSDEKERMQILVKAAMQRPPELPEQNL
jgi:hypothetical protein